MCQKSANANIQYPPKESRIRLYKEKIKRKNEELHALQSDLLAVHQTKTPAELATGYAKASALEREIDGMIKSLKQLHNEAPTIRVVSDAPAEPCRPPTAKPAMWARNSSPGGAVNISMNPLCAWSGSAASAGLDVI